jgi:hypothetical protein
MIYLKCEKKKLLLKKKDLYNMFYEDSFDNMILEVFKKESLSKNYYIDYCKKDDTLLAAGLYFLNQDKVIGYICAHTLMHKQPS